MMFGREYEGYLVFIAFYIKIIVLFSKISIITNSSNTYI